MKLHETQLALFKLYMNSGYRLAYRLDPDEFSRSLGLGPEERDFLLSLSSEEIHDFAEALGAKRRIIVSRGVPTAYRWLLANKPEVIREFTDLYVQRPSDPPGSYVADFVEYLRECASFYDDVPRTVAEVARFEWLLATANTHASAAPTVGPAGGASGPGDCGFGWNAVYWRPRGTYTGGFRADVVDVVLNQGGMDVPERPTSVVVAARSGGRFPTVLRVTRAASWLVENMAEPVRAEELLTAEGAGELGLERESGRAILRKLTGAGVIAHACAQCTAG